MSYDHEQSSGIFDQGLFGLSDMFGQMADGLGAVDSIVGVSARTRSTAVQALQRDLIVLGLLPSTGADGYLGPNTMTALTTSLTRLGFPHDAAHMVTRTSAGLITVPDIDLEAIHAAAVAGKFPSQSVATPPPVTPGAPPPPSGSQSDIQTGPGKTFPDATVSTPPSGDGMLPTTTPGSPGVAPAPTSSGSSKWIPIAVIGGGAVLIAGVAYFATRKPSAPKPNRRRRGKKRARR